jgi:peptidoglycan/LPS O-acetylase OafA/YrhL
VLAVFLFHYYHSSISLIDNVCCRHLANIFNGSGYLGVDFFFTLSGFLITLLLISSDSFDLGRFYWRRILRIVPLYAVIVAVVYGVSLLSNHPLQLPPIGYVLSFTANFFYTFHGSNYLFAITLLWSLSVEMQFYFIWGLVLKLAKKHICLLAGSLILVSIIAKWVLAGHIDDYFLLTTYMPDFMIGAIAAKFARDGLLNFASINKWVKLPLYLGAILIFIFTPFLNTFFVWRLVCNLVFSLFTVSIILDQCSGSGVFEAGRSRLISHLGKVSYGIYCFQGFIIPLYADKLLPHFVKYGSVFHTLVAPGLLFAVTGLLATISFRYFESYFLRLKGGSA